MPKDMYKQEIRPGDPIVQITYGQIAYGVVRGLTDSCILTTVVGREAHSVTGASYRNYWNLQPYRKDFGDHQTPDQINHNIIKLTEDQYYVLCKESGKDPRADLLKENPRIFDKKTVY